MNVIIKRVYRLWIDYELSDILNTVYLKKYTSFFVKSLKKKSLQKLNLYYLVKILI